MVEIWRRKSMIRIQQCLHFAISVLLLFMLTGCVPTILSGYVPSGPGTLERRYCAGPGIKDALRIVTDSGVQIDLRAGQNRRNSTITLDVRLTVPETVTVQLFSSELVLESSEWLKPRSLPIDRILGTGTKPGPNYYAPTEKLLGGVSSPGLFSLWFLKGDKGTTFETGVSKVSSFTLKFPPLTINGRTQQIDPISFEAYEKFSVYTCVQ